MADANTTSIIQLDTARHRIAMEAAYEVEALSVILREQAKRAGMEAEYAIRGLAYRINDLSQIISQALFISEVSTPTNDLSTRLRGEAIEQEAGHV